MITVLFAVLMALQLLDAGTTYYALTKTGAQELNPAAHWLFEKIGLVPALVITKGTVVAVFVVFSYPVWFYAIFIGLYTAVVGNNAYHIYKSKAGSK